MAKYLKAVNYNAQTDEYVKAENIKVDNDTTVKDHLDDLEDDSGWTALGSYVRYRKVGSWVCVRIRQAGGTAVNPGDIIATLPAGNIPSINMVQANAYSSGGWLYIYPSGTANAGKIEFNTSGSATNYIGCVMTFPV